MNSTKQKETEAQSYLSFQLNKEEYAAHVSNVLNIIEVGEIAKLPRAPHYIRGILNLRGQVLPVLDIKKRFGMGETIEDKNTCIVVMEVDVQRDKKQSFSIGILVDRVLAVHEIEPSEIKEPPDLGAIYSTDIISGIVEKNKHFIMLLDMEKIFNKEEWQEIQDETQQTV